MGMISENHDVFSDVLQGTVLALLFFIIIIADIDQNLENSVSRLFADDTKVNAKIETQDDTLQHAHAILLKSTQLESIKLAALQEVAGLPRRYTVNYSEQAFKRAPSLLLRDGGGVYTSPYFKTPNFYQNQ